MWHCCKTTLRLQVVIMPTSLQWRQNERHRVSNHQHLDHLLRRLFRRTSKKTSKIYATGLCEWNPLVMSGFPNKGPVTRKMFPFDHHGYPKWWHHIFMTGGTSGLSLWQYPMQPVTTNFMLWQLSLFSLSDKDSTILIVKFCCPLPKSCNFILHHHRNLRHIP